MLELALLVLRAVGLLLVRHVMLQDGVTGLALFFARGGDACMRAVERAQVLAPDAGRRLQCCSMWAPVAHDLCRDTALRRQHTASSDFLFR